MAKLLNVFPLSIFHDRLGLSDSYRQALVAQVQQMEQQSRSSKPAHSAWLGDTSGHEFLFENPAFGEMYRAIHRKIVDYVEALGMQSSLLKFYFQRSWATVTRHGEHINQHCHEQSNISVAYYLRKPAGTGGINFITDAHPNEFARGIFTPSKESLGFIARPSIATWNTVYLDPGEDDIVIFPSKTMHATATNEAGAERISISADITTVLRNTTGHETMMPDIRFWRCFEE
ncbi:MAG: hypothetical protein KDB23_25510 [Planctomycetales bacterium]|nr:hypothetical protein [Planctomycetales bacterium]